MRGPEKQRGACAFAAHRKRVLQSATLAVSSISTNFPVSPTDPAAVCPRCGLTRAELNQQGRMGCATCYQTFEDVVVQATAALHGAKLAEAPPLTPPRHNAPNSASSAGPSAEND